MKAGTNQKIKFKKLKLKMRAPEYQVWGILENLMQLTAANAIEGNIGRFSNEDIAVQLEWEGDPDELIRWLVECGWLDESKPHR